MSGERTESGKRDAGRVQHGRIPLWRAICTCLAVLPLVIALAHGPTEPTAITQHALGAWEAAFALVLFCELGLRTAYAFLRKTALLHALGRIRIAWSLALAALAATSLTIEATLALVLADTVALLVFRLSRPRWDHRTAAVRPHGDEPARDRARCPLELTAREHQDGHEVGVRIRGSLGQLAKQSLQSGRASVLGLTLMATTIAIAMATTGFTWTVAPKLLADIQGHGGAQRTTTTTTTTAPAPGERSPGKHAETTTEATVTTEAVVTETTPSQSPCQEAPRNSVAEQIEAEIQELYTGEAVIHGEKTDRYPLPERVGPTPGRREGGCTIEYHEQITSLGTVVWAWGQSPEDGEVMSIAVDSRCYGPAIFLAPAAHQVKRLIARFGIVGGIRRYEAGTGDFYPVRTPVGTFLLIRREKSAEYELLPPAAAQKWAQAIRSAHLFLWPVALPGGGWGLYTDAISSERWSTVPDASWSTEEPELGEDELQEDAAKAHKP